MSRSIGRILGDAVLALAAAVMFVSAVSAQTGDNNAQAQTPPSLKQATPAETAAKNEVIAYKEFYDARGHDPAQVIELGNAFLARYPTSHYATAVHAELATVYLGQQNEDKFLENAREVLAVNPDDIDVLPLVAMVIPRRVKMNMPDAVQRLQEARAYAHHGIDVLNAMAKPAQLDDLQFQKIKNDKLALCHSGLGGADIKERKYADAVVELKQATELAGAADPVDFFMLGAADDATNHFTNAVAAYGECATIGPLQSQCKAGIEQVKKDSQNKKEAAE
jgi:tetratricopeptide (TPR) repeat protein